MPDPILLADVLDPDELTAEMTTEVAEHFARSSPKDQRGYVLAAARIAEASRTTLAFALGMLVEVATAYDEPGEKLADCEPGKLYIGKESSFGVPIAPTTFIPFIEPERAPRRYGRKSGRKG